MIKIEHVTKHYGQLAVLKDITAEIRQGEVVAVIGPSGTGKSTLLRCLNLLEKPTSGNISIDGVDLLGADTDVPKVRQKMNMVFQSFNLFSHLTVLENLTLAPIKLRGISHADAENQGRELLKLVGLAAKANSFPDELSGGQKQRVAIARCLAMEPSIILFDEPTSALDPTMVSEVLAVIRRLAKDGMTMIIVTHEMDFARDVANRVFYMDEGLIYEEGPSAEIFANPKREKTRAFIQRIRSYTYLIDSPDFDFYAMNGELEVFCERQFLPRKTRDNLLLLVEEIVQLYRPHLPTTTVTLTVNYSEKTGLLTMQFASNRVVGNVLKTEGLDDDLGVNLVTHFAERIDYRADNDGDRLEIEVKKT